MISLAPTDGIAVGGPSCRRSWRVGGCVDMNGVAIGGGWGLVSARQDSQARNTSLLVGVKDDQPRAYRADRGGRPFVLTIMAGGGCVVGSQARDVTATAREAATTPTPSNTTISLRVTDCHPGNPPSFVTAIVTTFDWRHYQPPTYASSTAARGRTAWSPCPLA